ncbi:MAG: VWA domain-containing protein, partial [Pseudobdellovibrionaceae bacterium]
MRFENVAAFYWIPVVIVGMFFISLSLKQTRKKIEKNIGKKMTPFLTASLSTKKRTFKLFLQGLCLLFIILAWARPQMGESVQEIKSQGVELILATDVSESMLAEDVRPSRLEFAKKEMQRLVDKLPGHKFGIVAFAGSAALISPISSDPSAIKMFIEGLSPESVSSQGTNFEAAIKESVDAFKRGGAQQDNVTKVTRVLLFVSDGEDHEPGALSAAEEAVSKDGMRIFAIAVGTE